MTRPRVSLYIASSLDGFIARPDGSFDWLDFIDRPGEDYGYHAFYATVDVLVMGRGTYDVCTSFASWPYPDRPSVVFTHRTDLPPRDGVEFVSGGVARVLEELGARGYKRAWLVGGGALARQCQEEGVLDEYIISMLPILIGEGLPLFPGPWNEQKLSLVESRAYESGLVQGVWAARP